MHKAIRNLTRLFERIQDFEKRVVERRGELSREDAEALAGALVLLAQALSPFAPHAAEGLLIASGREDGPGLLGPWPDPTNVLLNRNNQTNASRVASLGEGK
jgi:leucyl-tRNA synthetase